MENNDKKDESDYSNSEEDLIEYEKRGEWENKYRDEYALDQDRYGFWELAIKNHSYRGILSLVASFLCLFFGYG